MELGTESEGVTDNISRVFGAARNYGAEPGGAVDFVRRENVDNACVWPSFTEYWKSMSHYPSVLATRSLGG